MEQEQLFKTIPVPQIYFASISMFYLGDQVLIDLALLILLYTQNIQKSRVSIAKKSLNIGLIRAMKKDFTKWHGKKSVIDEIEKRPFFHEREVWFCYVGANVGFEQDGQGEDFLRPMVIIKKFNNEIFWGIPLTKSKKKPSSKADKYYYKFSFLPEIESTAILSQIRLIDAKRLSRNIGSMTETQFQELNKKLKDLLP